MKTLKYFLYIFVLFIFLFVGTSCNSKQESNPENQDTTDVTNDDGLTPPTQEETSDEQPQPSLTPMETVIKWLKEEYENMELTNNVSFPSSYPDYQSVLKWQSFDEDILTSKGVYTAPIVDKDIEVLCIIQVDGETKLIHIPLHAKGYGTVWDAITQYIDKVLGSSIDNNTSLPTRTPDYNCNISWESSNPELFSIDGTFNKPENDTEFTLKYTVDFNGEQKTFNKVMVAKGLTDLQRAYQVQLVYDEIYSKITTVNTNMDLMTTSSKYDSIISWESSNSAIISSTGQYHYSLFDEKVDLTVSIQVGNAVVKSTYTVSVNAYNIPEGWESIETYLNSIAKPEINTINEFYLYGSEAGYEKVPTQNKGYLPFFNSNDLNIIQEIVPMTNTTIRPGVNRTQTKYVVIHNTGMAAPSATAKALSRSIQNSTRQASWHFTVDDYEAYQELGINEVAWHAGTSEGNNYGIAIESCVYQGVDFNKVMRRVAKLTAKLLIDYNLGFDDVKQHYDFSGKNCPQVIRESHRWDEFMDLVKIEYFGQKNLKDVKFVWKSLSPQIMDDTGSIINHPGYQTTVKYQVTVTYNNQTKIYTYESTLRPLN